MFKFENGTMKTAPYVEIEGKRYDVHMPEFEGTTPFSAENLNKMQKELEGVLLWQNPNPTDDFGTTSIQIRNLNRYKVIEIYYKSKKNSTEIGCEKMIVNSVKRLNCVERDLSHSSRLASFSTASIIFTNAEFCDNSGNVSTDNSRIIPLYVVGYNVSTFDE